MMDENLTYGTDVPNFGLNSFNDDALDENHENDIIFSVITKNFFFKIYKL